MIRSTNEAAADLGLKRTTVLKWCRVLGFEKVGWEGKYYLLTDRQVDMIRRRPDRRSEWRKLKTRV